MALWPPLWPTFEIYYIILNLVRYAKQKKRKLGIVQFEIEKIVRHTKLQKRKLGIVWFGLGLVPPHTKLILL
jgi:hypothetical protein